MATGFFGGQMMQSAPAPAAMVAGGARNPMMSADSNAAAPGNASGLVTL